MDFGGAGRGGIRPENRLLYENIFRMIDKDGGGDLDADELKRALASMGEKLTDADVRDIINEIDDNGDGTVDMGEFMNLIEARIRDPDLMKYSYEAFNLFSETKEDHLTKKELMDILGFFNKQLSKDDVELILEKVPWEDDNTLNIKTFLTMFYEEL